MTDKKLGTLIARNKKILRVLSQMVKLGNLIQKHIF